MSRKPSSYNYKRLSSRVRESTIETHVSAPRPSVGHRKGANQRYARSAVRGEIRQVLPNTTTREDRFAYEARMNRRSYVERNVAAGRRRKIALVAALAVLIVIVACVVASFVFANGINSRLVLDDSSLKSALVADSGEGKATYSLLCADFDDGEDGASPDSIVVMRTDPEANTAYAISLPSNTRVSTDGSSRTSLGEIRASEGSAGLVSAVNSLLGIKLSHYATIDAQNFAQLVDELGGIDVNLPEDIVDAQAGDMRLSAGEQTLGGEQAVFACRADDYAVNAEETRGKVQALVAVALMQKATSVEGGFGYYMRMDGLANLVQTDMDVKAIGAFLESIRSISTENMQVAALPTYSAQSSGKTYQVPADDAITEMMNRIRAGETPQANAADVLGSIDAGSYTVSVYNGGDVVGAASEAADMLRQVGFNVTDTGNTSMQVYDETLVVYGDADKENAANAVVAALGIGRTLQDTVHYSFDTNVYVVIGKDWRTVLAARNETVDEDGNIVPLSQKDASATSSDESNSSASSDSDVDAEGSFAAAANSAA